MTPLILGSIGFAIFIIGGLIMALNGRRMAKKFKTNATSFMTGSSINAFEVYNGLGKNVVFHIISVVTLGLGSFLSISALIWQIVVWAIHAS